MIRYGLGVIFSFFLVCTLNAQVKELLPPTEKEKTALTKVVTAYLEYVTKMSTAVTADQKKVLTLPIMRDILMKGQDVMGVNDLDSLDKKELQKIMAYAYGLPNLGLPNLKHNIEPSSLVFGKLKYDQWRRFYYAEVIAVKSVQWDTYTTTKKPIVDTLSGKVDSVSVADTVVVTRQNKVTFFIRYEVENGVSSNYRLMGMFLAGQQPTLPPLGPLQQWWSGLDAEWKSFLLTMRKMEEYPQESDLERLTYQQELNFENAKFKTYEPLAAFTNVKKLIVKGSTIPSFEPISKMTALTYLDVSKTAITSISGVEKLTRLEEFYCVGNHLATIKPVATVTSLVKFDCSENELDSIDAVKNLVNLKELNVSLNIKLKNIDAVRELVNMEKISFRKIEIKDLTPIRKMTYLVYLDCYNTGITDLEPIRNMQKIFHLDLSNNKVTSLDPIRNYRYIVNLYLNSSSVADLSVVDNFIYLKELEISGCPQITGLGGVHKSTTILVLKCHYTGIGKDEVQRFKKNHPNCAITYY